MSDKRWGMTAEDNYRIKDYTDCTDCRGRLGVGRLGVPEWIGTKMFDRKDAKN